MPDLKPRLRRRVGLTALGADGPLRDPWEDTDGVLDRYLLYAARAVAARLASARPHLLSGLHSVGTEADVPGSLATVRVERAGETVEPRTFMGAVRRPVSGCYVEADGRLVSTDPDPTAAPLSVVVVDAPTGPDDLDEALHEAVIEEAAASVLLAIGGDGPSAWGRADVALRALV